MPTALRCVLSLLLGTILVAAVRGQQDDIVGAVRKLAAADPHLVHVEALQPQPQREALVFDTAGVVWLGEQLAAAVLRASK